MSASTPPYISPADAAELVRHGKPVEGVRIAEFRDVLAALGAEAVGRRLSVIDCLIDSARCAGMEISLPIEFVSTGRDGDGTGHSKTSFAGEADFGRCVFRNDAIFRCEFHGGAEFSDSRFTERAAFSDAVFNDAAEFRGVRFDHEAHFVLTTFRRGALFTGAEFRHAAQFSGASFLRSAEFASAQFHDTAIFLASRFRSASFFGATFHGMAQFNGAVIRGSLVLEFCKVKGTLDLHVDPAWPMDSERGWLNVAEVDVSQGGRLRIPMDLIGHNQRARFPRPRDPGRAGLRSMRAMRWPLRLRRIMNKRVPSVYLIEGEEQHDPVRLRAAAEQYNMLRDNFRGLPGREDEEDRCHYKFKDLTRRATRGNSLWRFWDWAVMKWCLGYGIYSRRIIITQIGVILGFALIYKLCLIIGGSYVVIHHYDDQFNSLYFSVITFTTIGYGDYAPRGILRVFAGAEGLLGMVLTSIFTVSFARKLIR